MKKNYFTVKSLFYVLLLISISNFANNHYSNIKTINKQNKDTQVYKSNTFDNKFNYDNNKNNKINIKFLETNNNKVLENSYLSNKNIYDNNKFNTYNNNNKIFKSKLKFKEESQEKIFKKSIKINNQDCTNSTCINGVCYQNTCFCKNRYYGNNCEKSIDYVDFNILLLFTLVLVLLVSFFIGNFLAKLIFLKSKNKGNYSSSSNNSTEVLETENFIMLTKEK